MHHVDIEEASLYHREAVDIAANRSSAGRRVVSVPVFPRQHVIPCELRRETPEPSMSPHIALAAPTAFAAIYRVCMAFTATDAELLAVYAGTVHGYPIDAARQRLSALPSGRHYGASRDSDCWVMVGRDLRDVTTWSIVPPAASLTLAWGEGGCTVESSGGTLQMHPGDWMWIDAGFAHRGENLPGSNFLTVFIPDRYVAAASLDIAPIGAAAQHAPVALAELLTRLAVLLLDGAPTRVIEAPILDTILDWVGTTFAPLMETSERDATAARAAAMLRADHRGDIGLGEIAKAVGVSRSELSRRFKVCYRLTPKLYRKQLRLALATRDLACGSSVLAAAHNAGFSDTAHLSRAFREQYGIAPSRWSRHIAGAGTDAAPRR